MVPVMNRNFKSSADWKSDDANLSIFRYIDASYKRQKKNEKISTNLVFFTRVSCDIFKNNLDHGEHFSGYIS